MNHPQEGEEEVNREEAVKALNVEPHELDMILSWACAYIAATPEEQRDYRHYGASWCLDPKLMVLKMKSCGKHVADMPLPLGELEAYLKQGRKIRSLVSGISKGMAAMMEREIVKAIEGSRQPPEPLDNI